MEARTATGPVVVGVDATPSASAAVDWAVELAAATGWSLHLLHAEPRDPSAPAPQVASYLGAHVTTARRAGVAGTTVEVVAGSPVVALRSGAREARMLVVGSSPAGAPPGVRVGGVALALVGGVDCPVAIVRGPAPGPAPSRRGRVVVGTDGSPAARHAVEVAAELADTLRSELLVVHAWTDVAATPHGLHRRTESFPAQEHAARATLDDELRRVAEARPGLAVAGELVAATALQALLDRASEARMVVVGHGAAAPGMASGSTMRSLVEFAPCTVVCVPSGAEALAGLHNGRAAPPRGPAGVAADGQ